MRKNCLLFVAIAAMALLFNACSNEEMWEDATPKVEEEAEGGEMRTKSGGDDKYDLLGYGYDITGNYLHPNSSKAIVIDVKKLDETESKYNLKPIDYNHTTSETTDFYYGSNAVDYLEDINKKVISNNSANNTSPLSFLSGKVLGFTATLNFDQEIHSTYKYISKDSYARSETIIRTRGLKINRQPFELYSYLSNDFKNHLETYSPELLIDMYGTHVLLDITIGGRVSSEFRSTYLETDTYEKKVTHVKAGLNVGLKLIGLNTDNDITTTDIEKLNKKNITQKMHVKSYGGSVGINKSYDFVNNTPPKLDISGWENSVYQNEGKKAALIEVNWNKAYPLYEFIENPTKREQVKQALIKYIKDRQVELIEVIPMYRLWDNRKGHNDSFYTTKLYEYENYPIDVNIHRNGIECYLLKNKLPGSVPVHRFYDRTGHNHIDIFGDGEFPAYNSWCEYQGIQGYAYINKQPGTVVVHALYDSRGQNCILVTDESILDSYKAWCTYNGTRSWVFPGNQ